MSKRISIKPQISVLDSRFIHKLIGNNLSWGRTKLSVEIRKIWNWCDVLGNPKDISCRDMLRRMDAKGQIQLPYKFGGREFRCRTPNRIQHLLHDMSATQCPIKDVLRSVSALLKRAGAGSDEYKSLCAQVFTTWVLKRRWAKTSSTWSIRYTCQLLACLSRDPYNATILYAE